MNKSAIRSELVQARKWTKFCALKSKLQTGGLGHKEAYAQAASELLGHDVLSEEKAKAEEKAESKLDGLVEGARVGGHASTPECVAWVARHMLIKDVAPEKAPSSEAWSMLCWARRNNQNEAQFWGQIYTKLLPSKAQLETEQRYRDDGRKVLEVIDKLRNEPE
jgi:hypothetical protein